MEPLLEKFAKLGCDNAPGQEGRQKTVELELRGEKLEGIPVDFSHGDVDAFPPIPGALTDFVGGVEKVGARQAYTEYRGGRRTREDLAGKLSAFTGAAIDPEKNIILAPGTQGALFLAVGGLLGNRGSGTRWPGSGGAGASLPGWCKAVSVLQPQ